MIKLIPRIDLQAISKKFVKINLLFSIVYSFLVICDADGGLVKTSFITN